MFDELKKINDEKSQRLIDDTKHEEIIVSSMQTQEIILKSFQSLVNYLDQRVSKTQVVNQLQAIGTPDAFKVVDAVDSLHETLKTHENTDLSEVTQVMQAILEEAKQIPKEHPEEKEERDYSKQFESLLKATQAVEKVVKEQKLIAEAPIVNVPETKVEVTPPDLKPLQTSIKDVVTAVKAVVIPEYKTDNSEVEKLLKKSNKLLTDLLDKPMGGYGGGMGSSWMAVDTNDVPVPIQLTADGKVPVEAGATSTYQSFNDTTTDVNLVYLGKSVAGTATSAGSWQIKRYNKSAGTMTFADDITAFTKTWDDRTSYGY